MGGGGWGVDDKWNQRIDIKQTDLCRATNYDCQKRQNQYLPRRIHTIDYTAPCIFIQGKALSIQTNMQAKRKKKMVFHYYI